MKIDFLPQNIKLQQEKKSKISNQRMTPIYGTKNGKYRCICRFSLCPWQNSNLQPFAPQANALSNCATEASHYPWERPIYTAGRGKRQAFAGGFSN
jgi:hypothetical protein